MKVNEIESTAQIGDMLEILGSDASDDLTSIIEHCKQLAVQERESPSISERRAQLGDAIADLKKAARSLERVAPFASARAQFELQTWMGWCEQAQDTIEVAGGSGRLFARTYAPPEWHLAIMLCRLYLDCCREREVRNTRENFIRLFNYGCEVAFGGGFRRKGDVTGSKPDKPKEAYRICRAIADIDARMKTLTHERIRCIETGNKKRLAEIDDEGADLLQQRREAWKTKYGYIAA